MKFAVSGLSVLLVASLLAPRISPAQGFGYAPGTHVYRVSSVAKRSQEVNGQKMDADITSSQRVSVALTPKAGDSLQFVFTLDSVSMTSSMPELQQDLAKLNGSTVTGAMSKLGKASSAVSSLPAEDNEAKRVAEGVKRFFVAFPSSPQAGMTWADTTVSKPAAEGLDITTNSISTYKLVGDTTFAGEKAWKVERTSAETVTGTGNQGGQVLVLEGTGTSIGTAFVSLKGVYLGSTESENSAITVTLPAAGMTIPITSSSTNKVEKVK